MASIWTDIKDTLTAPFVGELDLAHLFLLIGVILIFILLWMLVINHIAIAAAEI